MRGWYGKGFGLRKTLLKSDGGGDAICSAACLLVCLHLFLFFLFSSPANEEVRPHTPGAPVCRPRRRACGEGVASPTLSRASTLPAAQLQAGGLARHGVRALVHSLPFIFPLHARNSEKLQLVKKRRLRQHPRAGVHLDLRCVALSALQRPPCSYVTFRYGCTAPR